MTISSLIAMHDVLRVHPDLASDGFSPSSEGRAGMCTPHMLAVFERCVSWLGAAPRSPRPIVGSYWAKRILERLAGVYVPNGALIAAAVHLDMQMRRDKSNADLAIDLPWVQREDERSHTADEFRRQHRGSAAPAVAR